MVDAARIRAPATVALVGLGTLGLGFAWYYFQAFREVDLDAGRRHSALYFLAFLPLVGPVFALVYTVLEIRGLQAARQALGLDPGMGPWRHAGLVAVGTLGAAALAFPAWLWARDAFGADSWGEVLVPAAIVGWFSLCLAAPLLAPSVNGYWEARLSGKPAPPAP